MGKRQLTTKVGTAVVAVSTWAGFPFLLHPGSQPFSVINKIEDYLKHEWARRFYKTEFATPHSAYRELPLRFL